jgi:acyl-CoA thioesterase YciA
MRVEVEAWARDRHSEESNKVTQAVFAFVAVGEDRRPRPVRGMALTPP